MDADEREILNYLQTAGKNYISAREICRRAASKARFLEDPDWAKPILQLMAEKGILECDSGGRYRIKPKPKKTTGRWMSPEIAQILKESGIETESQTAEGLSETGSTETS